MKAIQAILAITMLFPVAHATDPPDLMNYQGVLRSSSGAPIDGSHDMVFRYWSAATGGDEIMIERHTTADSSPVVVSDGMFNVELGSGAIVDGPGPTDYESLQRLFKNYSTVWLEIEVTGEVLSPRVRVRTAAYAFNAMHLGGRHHDQFINDSNAPQSKVGELTLDASAEFESTAVTGIGSTAGGYFEDSTDNSFSYAGYNEHGIWAQGQTTGGRFETATGSAEAVIAKGDTGITASGSLIGGSFSSGTAQALIASGYIGVEATSNVTPGFFMNTFDGSNASLATAGVGVEGLGVSAGGVFADSDESGLAHLGEGDIGIRASGTEMGGLFQDIDHSGFAYVGRGHLGVDGRGENAGAYFGDLDETGYAWVAHGHFGINAVGAYQNFRNGGGGRFADSLYTGVAYVAHGNEGIYAEGTNAGGEFRDTDSAGWAQVGRSTYKIVGSGAVSFVQNHPDDADKVVVYHAPEASEVAVYTRGSARLQNGIAIVALDETFAWVANPDLGLTAHLTARGVPETLGVESLSTAELIVRGAEGSDAAFDFLVYGLRIGFEQVAPVQAKEREARIPAMDDHEATYAKLGDARRFNAFERFVESTADLKGVDRSSLDLSRSEGLAARIGRYDHALHAAESEPTRPEPVAPVRPASETAGVVEAIAVTEERAMTDAVVAERPIDDRTWLPVAEGVDPGDVLALDPRHPGRIVRASSIAYPQVVGIASGPVRRGDDGALEVPLAEERYATVQVDAGYGAIVPGDRLVASPTPGYAMLGLDTSAGFVIGHALEGLESGEGQLRVLLTLR